MTVKWKAETLMWAGAALVFGGGGVLAIATAFAMPVDWRPMEVWSAGIIVFAAGLFLLAVGAAKRVKDELWEDVDQVKAVSELESRVSAVEAEQRSHRCWFLVLLIPNMLTLASVLVILVRWVVP